jgi:hypothetical protein
MANAIQKDPDEVFPTEDQSLDSMANAIQKDPDEVFPTEDQSLDSMAKTIKKVPDFIGSFEGIVRYTKTEFDYTCM